MKHTLKALFAFVALAFVAAPAMAQDQAALVDALVKKGVLSGSEAEEIKSDLIDDWKKTPSGKIKLAKHVKKLKLYGDVRVRYQWEDARDQDLGGLGTEGTSTFQGDSNHDSKYRYRLRVGATYDFTDDFSAGVRFETENSHRSTNEDFENFFSKDSGDALYVGLAYLEWNKEYGTTTSYADPKDPKKLIEEYTPFAEVTIRGGKHKHMWENNKRLWDSDINPEGISAKVEFFDAFTSGLDLAFVGGIYVVDEEFNAESTDDRENIDEDYLFGGQIIGTYHFENKSKLTIAPGILGLTGGVDESASHSNRDGRDYYHDQLIFYVPVEYSWKMAGLPWKVFGSWGINLEADELIGTRGQSGDANPYYASSIFGDDITGDEDQFWTAGFQVGKAKKKGSWQISAEYAYFEAASYIQPLMDSDFGGGFLNQEGVRVSGRYAFTGFLYGTVTYVNTANIEEDLQSNVAPFTNTQLLQVDLNWKF